MGSGELDPVEVVVWSPDGRAFATRGYGDATLWDAATGSKRATLQGEVGDLPLAWSPDGRILALGNADGSIPLFDGASGAWLRTLKGHTDRVRALAWSPDGHTLASGSDDDTARLWDAASGSCRSILEPRTASLLELAWSPDGRHLATQAAGVVRVWDAASGTSPVRLAGHNDDVYAVDWSPDGRTLATCGFDGTARVWDVASRRQVRALEWHDPSPDPCSSRVSVVAVDWRADGRTLATGSDEGTVALWDIARDVPPVILDVSADVVDDLAWSPDGRTLAVGAINFESDNAVRLYDGETRELRATLEFPTDPADVGHVALEWSPDGRTLAVASDAAVHLCHEGTGATRETIPAQSEIVWDLAFSPEGRTLAIATPDGTRLWDVATRTLRGSLDGLARDLAWRQDGRILVTAGHPYLRFWDASTGTLLATTYSINRTDWLVTTPEGRYDGSPAARTLVECRVRGEFRPPEPDFYTPALLARLLRGGGQGEP